MFVYMTREGRQTVADVLDKLYQCGGKREPSAATLRSALDNAIDALEYAKSDGDEDEYDQRLSQGFVYEALEVLEALEAACAPVLPCHLQPRYLARRLCRAAHDRARQAYNRWRLRLRPPQPLSEPQRLALQTAQARLQAGEVEKVKAALALVGGKRVSELPDDDVPVFLAALAP